MGEPADIQTFCRVPLKKFKSIRETMKEQGLLEEFLKTHKYDPALKYKFGDFSVDYEPMAFMDVSPDPPRGSPLPAAKGQREGPGSEQHPPLCHPHPCSLLSAPPPGPHPPGREGRPY